MILAIAAELSCSQGSLTWDSLKVQKGHTKVKVELVRDFYVESIHVTLQHDTGNLRKVIAFTSSSQMLQAWKFIMVTQRSRSNLVEILVSRTSTPVQLQHNTGKFWCFIIFTRSCKILLWIWPISKGQKGQKEVNIDLVLDFDVENISVKLQNDTGNSCRVIVFTRFWVPPAARLPAQAMTIPFGLRGLRGKKAHM